MTPLPDLSNEQKLTYIYHMLKEQESRQKRALWYRVFKGFILGGILVLLYLYPTQIFGTIFSILKPVIVEQTQSIMEENKDTLIKNLKDVLPTGIELSPTKPKTTTPATPTTTPKTKTGTSTSTKVKPI